MDGGTGEKKRVTSCLAGLEFKKVMNVSICTGVWVENSDESVFIPNGVLIVCTFST